MADEAELDRNPDLSLAQKRFLLTCPDSLCSPAEREDTKKDLMLAIQRDGMLPFYKSVCRQFKWSLDAELARKMKQENQQQLEKLNAAIKDAEENLGESEVREGYLARAEFFCRIGAKDKAVAAFRETMDKTVGMGQKLDILFTLIRMGFFWDDNDLVERNIEKAKSLIEQGGDWDRRNRLKVYEGLYNITIRNFKQAADLFLEGLATFTSEELFPYNDFIFYTVLVSIVSVERVHLKQKVIDAPEILSVIRELGNLSEFLNSLYNSNYSTFFACLADITDKIRRDRYLAPHALHFCREMRILAYTQLLGSYRSVRLDSMAKDFGVSVDFLDRELSRFIAAGRLGCKIDKVGGIVETTRPDAKNAQYQAVIKQGDVVINRAYRLLRLVKT